MRRLKIVGIIILLIALLGLVVILMRQKSNTAYIDTLVAPSGSSVKVDGHGVVSGKHALKPGTHLVAAHKQGFIDQKQSVVVNKNETRFVGFVLVPNSASTTDWYKHHADDQQLSEAVASRNFDQANKDATLANPLLKKLPYIGPAFLFRIDYGVPSTTTKLGQTGIYIRYQTDLGKEAALAWIKNQGLDPSAMDIIYIQGEF